MTLDKAMNEIELLREYNENKTEYKNVCIILEKLSYIALTHTQDKFELIQFIRHLIHLYENSNGPREERMKFCEVYLLGLDINHVREELRDKYKMIIEEMYRFLLTSNTNQMTILLFLQMLFTDKPLTPLTDTMDDWDEVGEVDGFRIFSHKRCDKVFKNEKTGNISYLEGTVFITKEGKCIINEYSAVDLKLPSMLPDTKYVNL